MSLQTWKDEFYPTEAIDDKSIAVSHSLKKWLGLTLKNLRKHNVVILKGTTCLVNESDAKLNAGKYYYDTIKCEKFLMTSITCSLCKTYTCETCPLGGKTVCDSEDSPYEVWLKTENPKPMIEKLRELL